MDRKTKGRLAEAKVLVWFIENGYEVYLPYVNNSKFDMLVAKDGDVSRVSVKFTSIQTPSGKWSIALRQVSRRNNGDVVVEKFDRSQIDIMAVYIGPLDKVLIIKSDTIQATTELTVGEN